MMISLKVVIYSVDNMEKAIRLPAGLCEQIFDCEFRVDTGLLSQ